ncbi:hypothetical protein Csa_023004 [Cucumis sativus]|uniref:Uncharacterized protein n=1 Tax=Cucumis sativus TaxID=3659 RepID=A0A0A0KER2_CUCSA|nr:hypothetical protein Csa_023004 [Cucumis sativus]
MLVDTMNLYCFRISILLFLEKLNKLPTRVGILIQRELELHSTFGSFHVGWKKCPFDPWQKSNKIGSGDAIAQGIRIMQLQSF